MPVVIYSVEPVVEMAGALRNAFIASIGVKDGLKPDDVKQHMARKIRVVQAMLKLLEVNPDSLLSRAEGADRMTEDGPTRVYRQRLYNWLEDHEFEQLARIAGRVHERGVKVGEVTEGLLRGFEDQDSKRTGSAAQSVRRTEKSL